VNEDFVVESLAGDIFQLGNQSYRIIRVETGRVRVEDAHGQAPSIPFWLGEAPGRSDVLSHGVARLRAQAEALLMQPSGANRLAPLLHWLTSALHIAPAAAHQIADYLARAHAALGALPTQDTLIIERFFDASGGTQLVIHTPFGSRINRAWGLALRKRFCRTFNFELQAAATDDAIILSLTLAHSFVLTDVWRYLRTATAEHVLIQALLDAPLFGVRWRWCATTALALPRYSGGRKTAPQLQRMKSDDLLAAVFPDQTACAENLAGEREVPTHPLLDQTLDDCLHDAMDASGWLALLARIETNAITLVTRDLPAPSPLAAEILNAKPYAFLDDPPLEERRTQAVLARPWTDPMTTDNLSALNTDAIAAVRDEAWPRVRDADEMHAALLGLACIADTEAHANAGWHTWLKMLAANRQATQLRLAGGRTLWLPVEQLTCLRAVYPNAPIDPPLHPPPGFTRTWEAAAALIEVLRARLTGFGPLSVEALALPLALPQPAIAAALAALENDGYAMRDRFTPDGHTEEWCERHLLARIHRYTVKRLRREIEPVERVDFMRFLCHWQGLTPDTQAAGPAALTAIAAQLAGFEAAASAWESDILPARLSGYLSGDIDRLCRSGKFTWLRISTAAKQTTTVLKTAPIVLLPRGHLATWRILRNPASRSCQDAEN